MRLFVAAPCRVTDAFARFTQRLGALDGRVRPVDPALAHVTLKFLGEVPDPRAPAVVDAVRRGLAAAGVRGFEARLVGVGAFPKESAPRVVWVGVEASRAPDVERLAAAVDDGLAAEGVERETRRFHAHVTAARVERLADPSALRRLLDDHRTTPFGTLVGTAAKVMRSTLTPRGPVYETVAEVPLP